MTARALRNLIMLLIAAVTGMSSPALALAPPVSSHLTNITANLSGPVRVAVDTAGNIYVADENNRRAIVLDAYGNQLFLIGGNDVPRSIAVDLQGRIYVGYMSDGQPGYVAVFDSSGQFIRYLGSGLGEFGLPGDIAISFSTGKVYVLDSLQNGVKVYDSSGNRVTDGQGNPFHIGGFGQYNGWSVTSNPGKFDLPSGITVDDIRGEVLVSDQNNYRVQVFDMDGNFRTAFGRAAPDTSWSFGNPQYDLRGRFSSIRGLSVDKEGRIYVVDAFQGAVQVLERNGTHLAFIGTQGMGVGQLNVPIDVTIDNQKRLIIADWNNNRLAIFQIDSGPAINNMAPGVPSQISPANAVQLGTVTPALTVYNAADPNGDMLNYRFEIDTSSSFTSPVAVTVAGGVTYTSATASALTDHTVYFWRVRAEEAATPEMFTGQWSATRNFYLSAVNRPPTAPSNLLPAAGSTARKSTSLSWGASTDPDLYDTLTYVVEISANSNFSSILLSQAGLGNTSARIDTLSNYTLLRSGTEYFWRVRALDNHGASSAYSGSGSFVYQQTLLQITSNPHGAKVYLAGNYAYQGSYKGTTGAEPLEIIEIEPGRHVVRIEKEGYFGYYTSIMLTQGETRTVDALLTEDEEGTRPFTKRLADSTGTSISDGVPAIVRSRPFVVDWDNDGNKDLLVGDDSGRIYLFENISTNASPIYEISRNYSEGVIVTAGTKAAPFAVDWNNDGKKDMLVGATDGTISVYLNGGSDESPTFGSSSHLSANGACIYATGTAAPFVVDWNNDGKKDLLIGEGSGKVRLFINTGTDDAPAFFDGNDVVQGLYIRSLDADLTVTADAVPFLADWDNDGKKDLLVGGAADVKVFTNTGTDEAPVFGAGTSQVTGTGLAPFVLDYNGDGFSDLLLGDESGYVSYHQFTGTEPAAGSASVKKKKENSRGFKNIMKFFKFW